MPGSKVGAWLFMAWRCSTTSLCKGQQHVTVLATRPGSWTTEAEVAKIWQEVEMQQAWHWWTCFGVQMEMPCPALGAYLTLEARLPH